MTSLHELHSGLMARFGELRGARGEHPVYFLEHGLDELALEDLVTAVSSECRRSPLWSSAWRTSHLPPIVVATEVGYSYRGTGTDFWPRLEERLATRLSPEDKRGLSELFRLASQEQGGVRPPGTTWAATFCHIAWPITHAVLPLELHRPFAETLAGLEYHRVDHYDDDSLFGAMERASTGRYGVRFASALADRSLVLALARHFLGLPDEHPAICSDTMARISLDLRRDRCSARSMDVARKRHEQASVAAKRARGAHRAAQRSSLAPLVGTLYLRRRARVTEPSAVQLEAALPRLPTELVSRARRALRLRRLAPRLWGASAPVPGEQILSGLPFRLVVSSLGELTGPLLPGLEELPVEPELKEQLGRFGLHVEEPLLFAERYDEPSAVQVRGKTATLGRAYWLLTSAPARPGPGVEVLGEVSGMRCLRVDTRQEEGRALLASVGVEARARLSVRWVGTPPEDPDTAVPRFHEEDVIVLEVGGTTSAAIEIQRAGDEPLSIAPPGLVCLDGAEGSHGIALLGDGRGEVAIEVGTSPPREDPCWITLEGEEPSTQALLGGGCSLRVDGVAALEGLRLGLGLQCGEISRTCSTPLVPLPAVIGPSAPVWDVLLDEPMREALGRGTRAELRAKVGEIADARWTLEPRLTRCWWEQAGGRYSLTSEEGPVPHGYVRAAAPTEPPRSEVDDGADGTMLIAMPREASDDFAESSGLFVTPHVMSLRHVAPRCPPLLRSRRSKGKRIGVEPLVAAMLRWRLAGASNLVADGRRRQIAALLERWVVTALCGSRWAELEAELARAVGSPWQRLIERCREAGVGFDGLVSLSVEDQAALEQLVAQELRVGLPGLWHAGTDTERPEGAYEALDLAFQRAYEVLAERHVSAGRHEAAELIADADPGSAPEQWDLVLVEARADAELDRLAELIVPPGGADELVALDYAHLDRPSLLDELDGWVRRHRAALQGRRWERGELDAALSMWLDPAAAVRIPWRSATERFVADRFTSRAVRYAALRRRAALAAIDACEVTV